MMDPAQREGLRALSLTWAPAADDLWRPQGAVHVQGLNDAVMQEVMRAFGNAEHDDRSSPLGVVLQGRAGSGKTHMLGQVRERVQAAGGYFFVVELLDATSFWESARSGILDSLCRPGVEHETQLKDVLWKLASIAHLSRAARRAVIGDDELSPETVEEFVEALYSARRQLERNCRPTLRALALLGSGSGRLQDIGEAFMNGADEQGDDGRKEWGLSATTATAQETVRHISRLTAVAGPIVLAVDQIDTLLAQSSERTGVPGVLTDNRDLEHVAHGLMAVRETTRRAVTVVACLPSVWELISERATKTVRDRFRVAPPLKPLPSADLGRAILERRFAADYEKAGFTPPYPSWPILPSAFADAPDYTPRQLLQRADKHIRWCLDHNEVRELEKLSPEETVTPPVGVPVNPPVTPPGPGLTTPVQLDGRFAEYRNRAVTGAVLDHEGEDTTVPELLRAALAAWIRERDGEHEFRVDDPRGARASLHARLRQSLDSATEDERHWAFRAIAASHPVAAQSRIRNACAATGMEPGGEKRKLFVLRNTPWPKGPKTAETVRAFEAAGGQTLEMSDDDLRTMIALRDLIDDNDPDLSRWLIDRQPAHGIDVLRKALGDEAGPIPAPIPVPEPTHPTVAHTTSAPSQALSPDSIPLGVEEATGRPCDIDLVALRKHTAIFAGSGSGKTVLLRRIVEECALRGVSSIVLDPNNDLSRLGSPWPSLPPGWTPEDSARSAEYLASTEVVVWTPNRANGRPLSFQPLPDFSSVVDDHDEFAEAVDSAVAALEPRALISGTTAKAVRSSAVLREALQFYGHRPTPTLRGFLDLLSDLPEDLSDLDDAGKIAADLSQNLRAAMINDAMFGGHGTPADPSVLLTPSDGYRARVSVVNMVGLTSDQQREGFVNQLQMALFAWIKRNPAGERPLGGLLVMDEAQNFAPSQRKTASLRSTLALSSQARKYGLGLVFATQSPTGLHNYIPGNAATQFFGLLTAPTQIATANEIANAKGGRVPEISKLRAGNFYCAVEGLAFQRIRAPWCLSHHPHSAPTAEEVLALARKPLQPNGIAG